MIVSITSDQPINFVITSDTPDVVEVIDAQPINVVVSIVKDGKDGAQGQPGEPGTPAVNNTLEMVRAENETIEGNIDANGNTIVNLKNATENQEPITKAQADAYLVEAKTYADTVSAETVRWAGFWDASTGTYPTGAGIRRGDQYEISVAGTIAGIDYEVGDLIRARINTPGQSVANWSSSQGNVQQATESRQGSAKISTAVNAGDENSTNDVDVITSKKLWQNFWQRVLALSWTWNARQIFAVAPRLSSLENGQFLRLNSNKEIEGLTTIPISAIEDGLKRRFLFDINNRIVTGVLAETQHQFYMFSANTLRVGSKISLDGVIVKTIVGNTGNFFRLKHNTTPTANTGTILNLLNATTAIREVRLSIDLVVKPGNTADVFLKTTSVNGVGSATAAPVTISFNTAVDNYFYLTTQANNLLDVFTQRYFEIEGVY